MTKRNAFYSTSTPTAAETRAALEKILEAIRGDKELTETFLTASPKASEVRA